VPWISKSAPFNFGAHFQRFFRFEFILAGVFSAAIENPLPMAFWDFQDTRYTQARNLTILSVLSIVVVGCGVAALLWFDFLSEKTARSAEVAASEPSASPAPTPGPKELFANAKTAYADGDLDGAREIMKTIDLPQLALPSAWELAGLLQSDAGHQKAAIEIYTRGLAAGPSAELFYRRGLLYRDAGDFDRALEDLGRATRLWPTDIAISNQRLLLLIQMGRQDQVREEILARTTTGVPAAPNEWIFGLCGVALEKGQYAEAEVLLANAQKSMNRKTFQLLLGNPVISRYQNRPEILRFFFTNLQAEP
jgi:tetratricopeptide (TPR) repeat protein